MNQGIKDTVRAHQENNFHGKRKWHFNGQQRGAMNNDGTQMKHLAIQEGQETDAEPGADGAHLKHLAKQEGQESGPEPGRA